MTSTHRNGTHRTGHWAAAALGFATLTATVAAATTAGATAGGTGTGRGNQPTAKHVLLISIDGMHASDLSQCIANNLCPTLAALSRRGTTYAHATTSEPSDSSPGLMALATGASPKLAGIYYDDSYDRTMFTPPAQTSTSTQDCSGSAGAEMQYFENLDVNAPSTANGQIGNRTIMNEAIDPAQVPRALVNGSCVPVMPNDYLRANSIFSVAHAAGLRTAWADKHPAATQQVSGHGTPNSIDDKFFTEINADIIPPSLVDTRGNTVTFDVTNPGGAANNGYAITDSEHDTQSYDQIKVDAVLNQIDGLTSDGNPAPSVPAIFGMNFQAVSVGQKLIAVPCRAGNTGCPAGYQPGGYVPGSLDFTPQLTSAVQDVDGALGSMVSELAAKHLTDSTEIILTAKHGQSPIDPSKLQLIGHQVGDVLANAGVNVAQLTDDDVALVWLADQSQTQQAINALNADKAGANTARIDYVLSGKALADRFNSPSQDPRTPDLIVQPIPGTIYSHSTAKVAEHGGFSADDTHVALLVVPPSGDGGGATVQDAVTTSQVAPTILEALGLDAHQLDTVRTEHVKDLPAH